MNTPTTEAPIVKVALGQDIGKITGHSWPDFNDAAMELTAIESTNSLCIIFPSNRSWTTHSRVTLLSQRRGSVSSIIVSPLDTPQRFSSALATVRRATEELGIAGDLTITSKLHEWSMHPPQWGPFASHATGCALEPGVTLFLEIKPSSKAAEWYVTYQFTADQLFIDGSGVPSSKPVGP